MAEQSGLPQEQTHRMTVKICNTIDDIDLGRGDWPDTGCDYWRACLSCPFPSCLHDLNLTLRDRAFHQLRDAVIRRLYRAGATPLDLAVQFGVHRRSIYRVLGDEGRYRRMRAARAASAQEARAP